MRCLLLALVLSLVASFAPAAPAEPANPKIETVVKIVFPKDGYTFTLAEAAKGVKIEYQIVVAQDLAGVIAQPFGPSFTEPPGPSGLHPREQIAGNKQLYCLLDSGLGQPPPDVVKGLKKGTYAHSFLWDGRNWTGPSDFGIPKGQPFPAGTYEVTVTVQGKVVVDKATVPYKISERVKIVLK